MSYGLPPGPNVPPQGQQPEPMANPTHHPWPNTPQRPWDGRPGLQPPGQGPGRPDGGSGGETVVALVSLILGLIGCVVWLLPIPLDMIRQYTPLPFAVPGLILALVGCTGHRRGKPLAAFGVIFSLVALALAATLIFNYSR
jgi:hypothetical protein